MTINPYPVQPKPKENWLADAPLPLLNQLAELLKRLLAGLGNPTPKPVPQPRPFILNPICHG
ncbi:hypothetical protein [Parapedobacter sp. 10938]|uniref:hypothetical protein n=1 Tax=Parapedobacter flavus TaxID=3110225 RepID=UPI002DB85C1B|nr:hypothetical protein [Parapedobacter sp. 10938]MEC3879129.1 hypothetical protein [Parapedobacter sp. 10938]